MSESSFWNNLRGLLPPDGHYSRIESDTSVGIPDVNYCIRDEGQTFEGWIELKDQPDARIFHPFERKGLRPKQIEWITDRLLAGGRVSVIARVAETAYVLQGWTALRLNLLSLFQLNELARLRLRPAPKEHSITQLRLLLTVSYEEGDPNEAGSTSLRRYRNHVFKT